MFIGGDNRNKEFEYFQKPGFRFSKSQFERHFLVTDKGLKTGNNIGQ